MVRVDMAAVRGLTADPWLARIFGRAVFRVSVADRLSAEDATDDLCEQLEVGPVFAYAKVPTGNLAAVRYLEAHGFHLVDTSVVLEKPMGPGIQGRARLATGDDRAGTRDVARRSFVFSRFHLDPCIPKELADRVKEEWVDSYFSGRRGDAMVVGDRDGRVASFLAVLVDRDRKAAVIDLVAVDPRHQGNGLASDMIRFVEARYAHLPRFRVGTQIANAPSLELYAKHGFRLVESAYIFHYHGSAR